MPLISRELKKTSTSKRNQQETKDNWIDLFKMFCDLLIDSDSRDEILDEKVKTARRLADLALEQIEERWGDA